MPPQPKAPTKNEGLFDRDFRERRINRLLDKALAARVRQTQKNGKVKVNLGPKRTKSPARTRLAEALAKAMRTRAGERNRPSLRQSAPDTGGRAFHFEYYSVAKGDAPAAAAAPRKTRKGTSAGAHQRYIEREMAVEALYAPNERDLQPPERELPARPRGRPSKAALAERERLIEEQQREAMERSLGSRASAAQAYIENPAKMLMNGELGLSSFGNIGRTFPERLAFWKLVEEHEPQPDGRVQNRLILELPYQSTPQARLEIMRRFVEPLAQLGLPYHVAIHAPGEKNDDRNYHAHVIFSERPAKKMPHPVTGQEVWDFSITETYKTSSRHTKVSHPYRQNRAKELRDINVVRKMRASFAEIVTEVMAPIDPSVRYDPRSYEAMGLATKPIDAVPRLIHELMRDGKIVIQSTEWSNRMVRAEMTAAAQRRDPEVERLLASVEKLRTIKASWPDLKRINSHLTERSRIPTLTGFTRQTFGRIIEDRIRTETIVAQEKVIAAAEIEVCKKMIAATRPLSAKATRQRAARTPEEQEDLDLLNATAREDLVLARARLRDAEKTAKLAMKQNVSAFRTAADGPIRSAAAAVAETVLGRRRPSVQPAAAAAPAAPVPPPIAPTKVDLSKVLWEPDYEAEEAERRRKRYRTGNAQEAGPTAPAPPEPRRSRAAPRAAAAQATGPTAEPARTRGLDPKQPAAPAPTLEADPQDAQRLAAARKAFQEDLAKDVDKAMSSMWDPSLTGQALTNSLQPFIDLLRGKPADAKDPALTSSPAPLEEQPATNRQAEPPSPTVVAAPQPTASARAAETASAAPWIPPQAQAPRPFTRRDAARELAEDEARRGTTRGDAKRRPAPAQPVPVAASQDQVMAPTAPAEDRSAPPVQSVERPDTAAPPTRPAAAEPAQRSAQPASRVPLGRILEENHVVDRITPRAATPSRDQGAEPKRTVEPRPRYETAPSPSPPPLPAAPISQTQPDRTVTTRDTLEIAPTAAPIEPSAATPADTLGAPDTLPPAPTALAPGEVQRKNRRKAILAKKPCGRGGHGR